MWAAFHEFWSHSSFFWFHPWQDSIGIMHPASLWHWQKEIERIFNLPHLFIAEQLPWDWASSTASGIIPAFCYMHRVQWSGGENTFLDWKCLLSSGIAQTTENSIKFPLNQRFDLCLYHYVWKSIKPMSLSGMHCVHCHRCIFLRKWYIGWMGFKDSITPPPKKNIKLKPIKKHHEAPRPSRLKGITGSP